jgi:hypothetical protein
MVFRNVPQRANTAVFRCGGQNAIVRQEESETKT